MDSSCFVDDDHVLSAPVSALHELHVPHDLFQPVGDDNDLEHQDQLGRVSRLSGPGAAVLNGGIGKWTDAEHGCSESQRPPLFNGTVADDNVETWTVRQGRYTDFPSEVTNVDDFKGRKVCGYVPAGTSRTIFLFTETYCKKEWRQIEFMAHELGHAMPPRAVLRLTPTPLAACLRGFVSSLLRGEPAGRFRPSRPIRTTRSPTPSRTTPA